MTKFAAAQTPTAVEDGAYVMSNVVRSADSALFLHECFSFGDRPGVYSQRVQDAWEAAVDAEPDLWHAPMYPYMFRYHELVGNMESEDNPDGMTKDDIIEMLEPVWYRVEKNDE